MNRRANGRGPLQAFANVEVRSQSRGAVPKVVSTRAGEWMCRGSAGQIKRGALGPSLCNTPVRNATGRRRRSSFSAEVPLC